MEPLKRTAYQIELAIVRLKGTHLNLSAVSVVEDITHSLPQSKAFQDDVLPHQGRGVFERHFQVGGVFFDGT